MDLCKLDEAYESLEFVLNKDPEFAQAWFIKSKCLDLIERHEEALKCVDIGLHLIKMLLEVGFLKVLAYVVWKNMMKRLNVLI